MSDSSLLEAHSVSVHLTDDERAWLRAMPAWSGAEGPLTGEGITAKFDVLEQEIDRLRAGLQRLYDSPTCSDYAPHRHHQIVGPVLRGEA